MATHEPPAVRKKQILEAALQCFGEKGLRAATMDDLVEASGLSKGAIYSHFKSKDEIFFALYWLFELEIYQEWSELPADDPIEAMRRMGEIFISRLLANRALLDSWTEFLRQPASRASMADSYRDSRGMIADLLRVGIANGQVRACDPEHVAAALTALVEGLLLQAFIDPGFDPLAVWPAACDALFQGITK